MNTARQIFQTIIGYQRLVQTIDDILPHFLSDKVFAVFLAEPVSDILAASTTGTLFFTRLPRILGDRERQLRQET